MRFFILATLFTLLPTPGGLAASAKAVDYAFFPPPAGKGPAPVLFFVHGGAWIGGDKAAHEALGQAFAKRGICAVTLNYPLAPAAPHPAPVKELEKALREVPTLLPAPACDRARIYLAGHSAGAHLIGQWNSEYRNPAVKGFVGLEGIYDLPKLAARWPTYPDWFLKKAFGEAKNWARASPARRDPLGRAPWLLVHSAQDELVDTAQSEAMRDHLKEKKVSAELLTLDAGSHDEVVRRFGQPGDPATERAVKFVGP